MPSVSLSDPSFYLAITLWFTYYYESWVRQVMWYMYITTGHYINHYILNLYNQKLTSYSKMESTNTFLLDCLTGRLLVSSGSLPM